MVRPLSRRLALIEVEDALKAIVVSGNDRCTIVHRVVEVWPVDDVISTYGGQLTSSA
jgi:hypothetical protein